ncbi:predicted protein [Plenodomus lingam JN3]|uniref:Predicted protein n=1 Tax=Leptosphaeria maculans (strain JN3 / isolate v23.1.3 / race Av1-4-5-6-7-8) TaxID=985895 RepID=E4ZYZ6_LEPMJ|nr:predicted protein [Plenodomus lingam JN3]CBX96431.1 predicted protein [Plenodomus lingam JN3]
METGERTPASIPPLNAQDPAMSIRYRTGRALACCTIVVFVGFFFLVGFFELALSSKRE